MPEEERLNLVSTVEDEFTEPLERLETALEDVDDEIRQTGRGRDYVGIDVEVGAADAIAELEALDAAIETLDEDVTVGVDTELAEATTAEKELDRRFAELDHEGDRLDELAAGTVEIDTGHVEIDAVHADIDSPSPDVPDRESGSSAAAMRTSGGSEHRLFTIENIDEWEGAVEPFLDRERLGRRGGEVDRLDGLLDRDLEEVIDFDEAVNLAVEEESDVDLHTLREIDTPGVEGTVEAIDELNEADVTLLGDDDDGFRREMRRLRQDIGGLRPTMTGFHNAIAATIPILAVFVGAIPATIVGLGALGTAALGAAAALGGIAGLGAMGVMLSETGELDTQPIVDRLGEVTDAFVDAFAPLAQSFAPVLEEAITEFELMMGPLADASTGLLAFRDEFSGLVDFLGSSIPSFTRDLLAFTEAAMPLLTGIGQFLADVDLFGYFAAQLDQALPALAAMGQSLTEILPTIVNLSQGFLAVAGGITRAVGWVAALLNHFPMLTTMIGMVTAGVLTLVSASALWQIAMSGVVTRALTLAGTLVGRVAVAMNAHVANLLGVTAASWQAYAATAALLGVLTLGLAPVLGGISAGFASMGSNAKSARKELENFASVNNGLQGPNAFGSPQATGGASNPYQTGPLPSGGGGGQTVYEDHSTTVINADSRDSAARQQYSNEWERRQYRDSVFGG